MASVIYQSFIEDVLIGNIDCDTDSFKVMLTASTYTENNDTHEFRSSVTNEVTGTGYTAGGAAVTVSVARDDANNRVNITLGGASWTTATISGVRKAVYYKARGGAASADELVACIDNGSDVSVTAGTLTLSASTIRNQLP